MSYRILSFFIASYISVGCQSDPHGHLLTTKQPAIADVAGLYVFDRYDSIQESEMVPRKMKLDLRSDGSFEAYLIPARGMNRSHGYTGLRFASGKGKWKTSILGTLDPGGNDIWGVQLVSALNEFHDLELTGEGRLYGLIYTIGDPDQGEAILLKRSLD